MDIVVHGTKGGRKTFTPKKIGGLLDISADASEPSAMGKEAYAVRFVENNVIFSKYKIVRDVRGDKRTGFLGFSLFLQNNEKLSGSDIITLLNRVSKEYCQTYIPENDNNLKDIREDWTFLTRIEEEYRPKIKSLSSDDIETLQSGAKDDAFIFFKDDTELQKYFDVPYQEEYSPYRQILFVKEDLKKKPENPLNALRHSENNLTGRIDLENPKYKLIYNQTAKGGVKIEVKVNGAFRHSKSKIRRKDELEISWSKPYYETVIKRGRWSDIENGFLDANDSLQTVSIKEIELSPRTKTITFQIKNRNGFPESDAEITCKSHYQPTPKPISNNQAEFTAEELGEKWRVSAKKGENLKSKEQSFIPENVSNSVEITLNEYKKVKFVVTDAESGNNIYNFKVWIQGKVDTKEISEFEFIGEDFDKTWNITFEKDGYSRSAAKQYNPKNGKNIVYGQIKKKEKPPVSIESEDENKVGDKKKSFSVNSKVIIASTVAVLVLGFGLWSLFFKSDVTEAKQTPEAEIEAYVEATELFDNKLATYKTQWQNQKPEIEEKDNTTWYNPMTWFAGKKETDSTKYKQWEEVSESIERAIAKRGYINNYNFDSLKTLRYSNEQQKFKETIIKIDSTKYEDLKNKFGGNISSWGLNQIADSISVFLNPPVKSEVKEPKEEVKEDKKVIDEPKKVVEQPKKQEQKPVEKTETTTENKDVANDITKQLQSGTVSKQQLQEWQSAGMDKYKNSIDLYLEFWSSVSNNQKSVFDDLLRKVKNDNILRNSELKKFLEGICKNSEAFQKYNSISGKATCKTINELKAKLK